MREEDIFIVDFSLCLHAYSFFGNAKCNFDYFRKKKL